MDVLWGKKKHRRNFVESTFSILFAELIFRLYFMIVQCNKHFLYIEILVQIKNYGYEITVVT